MTDDETEDTSSLAPVFFISDYGARCDGVSDDTPAIRKAIEAAHAAGGGTVYLMKRPTQNGDDRQS